MSFILYIGNNFPSSAQLNIDKEGYIVLCVLYAV